MPTYPYIQNAGLRPFPVTAVLVSLLTAFLLTGCTRGTPVKEFPVTPANMGTADLHRVKSEELRRLMRTMNMTLFEPEATPLDVDEQRLRRAQLIAELLGMIADELVLLGETELQLTPAERPLFTAYATELRGHARRFEGIAASSEAEAFMPAMRETVQTCNACHDRFRDM